MEQLLQNLHPAAALVLGLIVLAWVALMLMVPFMIEGIRTSTRKGQQELERMNRQLERLNALLTRQIAQARLAEPNRLAEEEPPPETEAAPDAAPKRSEPAAARTPAAARGARKEPIISDHAPYSDQREPRIGGELRRPRGNKQP